MHNQFWLYALNAIIFFQRGIEDLPSQGIFYYFKETLHYTPSTIMYIGSLISIAWFCKPLLGLIVDFFKLTKKQVILISVLLSTLVCTIIGLSPVISVPILIGLMIFASTTSATANVTVDGLMVVEGTKTNSCGAIQSVQWGAITIAGMITGVLGGFLAEHYTFQKIYLFLFPLYLIVLLFTWQYKATPSPIIKKEPMLPVLKALFCDKQILLFSLFIFLYNLSPSFSTPLLFIQRDTFHWSKLFIGLLGTIGASCSVLGAWLFWKYSKQIDLNKWLFASVFLGASSTLAYLYYTKISCVAYNVIDSVTSMFITLLMLTFMAKKAKPGLETVSFALLCSVNNITGTLDTALGAYLYPIIGLKWLIIIAASTSFLCLPLIKRIKL
jgi:predicted MFS family arabinose efflux permease